MLFLKNRKARVSIEPGTPISITYVEKTPLWKKISHKIKKVIKGATRTVKYVEEVVNESANVIEKSTDVVEKIKNF